ncbi:putative ferric-chelate reductase 1 [Pangasianodon hypophthalmus]|uniref:putative ferric-chelate reductase 1 n=1 Tax=Pangasianodon hypophthalmus TaxID=310915 RepID=UPI0023080E00|nr:putative ferric-chelate reductase 1 [Pangasianodon hypophthalmus]
MHLLFFVLLEMYTLSSVHAYPNGDIAPVCDSMMPTHTPFMPQNITEPYRVRVDRRTCRPGDMIRVTLESVDSTEFEGFMLQARPSSGNSAVGYFMPGNASLVRLHNCFNTEKSAISHSGANELTRIEVMWVAPLTAAPEDITFCATFVKNYIEFWTMVSSHTILLSSCPAPAVNCLMMPFCILIALGLYSSSSLTLL